MTNDTIADRLFVSVRTVERHLSNIYAKLHVSGKSARAAAAAAFALRAGRHDAVAQMGSGTDAAHSRGA
jgi:DNA-binding NarL/FixJ family response regulator